MGGGYESFMKNRYWILRHGKTIPSRGGLIDNGILEEYQLASDGVYQARLAGKSLLKELKENKICLVNVRICYSPFSRTNHIARVVASVLNIPFECTQCKAIKDIQERFFGSSYELKSHDKPEGGESVADVVTRFTRALVLMESEFEECVVLLVSHGDPLQILQAILNAAKELGRTQKIDLISIIEGIKVPSVLSQHRKFALETG